jgi:biotin carboxyl carrier protein
MTHDTTEFSLHDAIEVLRLLDADPNATLDIRCHGFRLQCVRGAAPGRTGSEWTGDAASEEPRRYTMLKAPAAGRFYGDEAVFSSGERLVRANIGTVVGRIQAGAKVTTILAGVEGTVAHACVTPDVFVEYGQTLLVIDPD